MSIQAIFNTGRVSRYHCNPPLAHLHQSNADHQWGVVAILFALHPNPTLALIHEGAFHDAGELGSGDLAYPVKQRHPEHAAAHEVVEARARLEAGVPAFELTDEDRAWLKLADRLEAYLYMKLHGQQGQWNEGHIAAVLELAEKLGCRPEVEEVFHA